MTLDVVGTQEAAQILKVEVQRIPRLRHTNKLPPEAELLAATPVWHRSDIEYFADTGKLPENKPEPLGVVGLAEAAEICRVDKSQIGRWRREGRFPAPALDKRLPKTSWKPGDGLAATPLWDRSEIERFAEERRDRRAA